MKKFIVPTLALLSLMFAIRAVVVWREVPQPAPPISPPPESPYPEYVAGVGLVEANTENIAIGAPMTGIVTDVYVKVGDHVTAGSPLFRIDARNQEADVSVRKATLALARANVLAARITLTDLRDQSSRSAVLWASQAGTEYERDRKQFAAEEAAAKLELAEADLDLAIAQLKASETELGRHTVRAPVEGELLQVKIHLGEYATAGILDLPLILIGNTHPMNVRVDVDEQNAWRVRAGAEAVAYLRGNREIRLPLRFVRFEPYVIPKKSLTGDIIERVDTRVLQVIFSLSRDDDRVHLGQQMDVFIDAAGPARNTAFNPRMNSSGENNPS